MSDAKIFNERGIDKDKGGKKNAPRCDADRKGSCEEPQRGQQQGEIEKLPDEPRLGEIEPCERNQEQRSCRRIHGHALGNLPVGQFQNALTKPRVVVHARVPFSREHETRLILSYHNFGYTPGRDVLVERFLEADRLGADVAKVAAMPRDRDDVITLLAATAIAEAKARIPLISMSMGPLGAATRMVGGVFGSSLSFAIGEGASAPGQMPIADLVAVFGALARSRGEP